MSDKIKLQPCPFCGTSDLLGFEPSHEGGWTVVKCRKCGCSGSTGRSTSEQEAIAWWNRRIAPAAPEQVAQGPLSHDEIHQAAFEMGGTEDGNYILSPDEIDEILDRVIQATTEQPDSVKVPRELAERLAGSPDVDPDCCVAYYRQQLRALLAGGD